MRICIPTVDDHGLSARLSPHFGSAPFFTVVDSESGEVLATRNTQAIHEHGNCDPTSAVAGLGVDVVVCRGLGWRALALLERQGLPVYRTEDWSVGDAVAALRAKRLSPMGAEHTCQHGA